MHFWIGTLDDHLPRWRLDESRIGTNPGLGFRPMPSRLKQGSLIWYDTKNDTAVNIWTHLLDDFLECMLYISNFHIIQNIPQCMYHVTHSYIINF